MKPFDPRLLRAAPAARRPVAVLAVVGVLQGVATIGLAVALTALVVAVVEGMPLRAPALWLAGVFVVRYLLDFVSRHGFAPFAWWRIVVGGIGLGAILVMGL